MYEGAAPQMGRQGFAALPSVPEVKSAGREVEAALQSAADATKKYVDLHNFGVRQEVEAKRAENDLERDKEFARRSALANGAEGSFWNADGKRNDDAVAGFIAEWNEKDEQIARPYIGWEAPRRDQAESRLNAERVRENVELKTLEEESRRRRQAFETNLMIAEEQDNYARFVGVLDDALQTGEISQSEAELRTLRFDKKRMNALAAASRGTLNPPPVTVGGKTYHGSAAAFAMQAARDGWTPPAEEGLEEKAEVEEVVTASSAQLPATGDVKLPKQRVTAQAGTLDITQLDMQSLDAAVKLSVPEVRVLQDGFTNGVFIEQYAEESGRVGFACKPTAPDAVKRVTAQAGVLGAIDTDAALSMVATVTLDQMANNSYMSTKEIVELFDTAGIYDSLGGGDAERGKARVRAVVQEWKERSEAGTTKVSAEAIRQMVAAKVESVSFGTETEWRRMEMLNPPVALGKQWEKPDRKKQPERFQQWRELKEVYDKYRDEYSIDNAMERREEKNGRVDKDEFAANAKDFYAWYMKEKHGELKKQWQDAARSWYTARALERLNDNLQVGAGGKAVYMGYSNEVAAVKSVLGQPLPNDLGAVAAVEAEGRLKREHSYASDKFRQKAAAAYKQLREFKAAAPVKAAEKKRQEERAARAREMERVNRLNVERSKPRESNWSWDGQDASMGMPACCTIPESEMKRLVEEMGYDASQVVYLVCNGKKIQVTDVNKSGRVELNAPAVEVIQKRPKKGEKWQLNGKLGYNYYFKKINTK